MTESTFFFLLFIFSQHDIKIDPKICNANFSHANQSQWMKTSLQFFFVEYPVTLNITLTLTICQITEVEWVVHVFHSLV